MEARRSFELSDCMRGMDCSSAWVYGCCGLWNMSSPGALSPAPPAMADPPLVADAGFILEPELDALAGLGLANRHQARAKPPFLKASSASGSFIGWEGRIFWRDKSNRRGTRLIEEG